MRIRADNLDHPGIDHGFFTREGGVSEGVYAGLNCGSGSSDDPEAVIENRSRVAAELGLNASNLLSLYQIHSPTVITVEAPWQERADQKPEADGMVTKRTDVGLGVLIADCAPVLFADAEAGIVGAAHSGWRGAVGGVNEATVDAMVKLGAERERICAAIGPCIHQPSYEVDQGFHDNLMSIDADNERFLVAGRRDGHYQFDLPGYVAMRLGKAGVGDVTVVGVDTYTDEDRFFSFRRTTHRGEPDYGRNIAVIRRTA